MITRSLALLVLAGPVSAQTVEHRTLPSPAAVYDLAGTVHVVPGTGSDIVVDITRGGSDAAKLSIASGVVGDRQTLRVIFPSDRISYQRYRTELEVDDDGTWDSNRRWRGHRVRIAPGAGLDAYADLTVHVPPGARLALYLAAGSAAVANIQGDLLADVDAASITTEHTKGALTLDTGSGDLVVRDAEGDLVLDAGSGGVTLTGVRGERLDVDAGSGDIEATSVAYARVKLDLGSGRTRVGGITADQLSIDAGSGDVDLTLLGPARRVNVDAGSGDVTLHLPKTFAADVNIDAGSGGVRSDYALQRYRDDETHYTGRIGDGSGRLSIDSGSGTIALLKTP